MTMRLVLCAALIAQPLAAQSPEAYRADAERIIAAALSDSAAHRRVTELSERFGHRFSGSASLEAAIDWVLAEMRRDGLANVRGEQVMVPRWVRGEESLALVRPRAAAIPMLGLGGSIATPSGGIEAEVMVVTSFEELTQRAAEAPGKIVLFDPPWRNYGFNVRFRSRGAIEAARVGAVASLIRSASSYSMRTPHTGAMQYDTTGTVRRIPHAAISAEDAAMLRRMIERGDRPVVRLRMSAQTLPDSPSRNVIGEITGRERPDEVVVLGGHIDSWDVGMGAMDDGGGVVAAWEALRVLQRLGIRPRRTIRVVGWTNEENGLRGGTGYRDAHAAELANHILAIESDGGVFRPTGFGFTGSDSAFALVRRIGALLRPIGADSITRGGGGADIGPIMQRGVPGMGLQVDGTRYFWFHHTEADTPDKLDPREMAQCVAAMAVMAYVAAEMPERLPR